MNCAGHFQIQWPEMVGFVAQLGTNPKLPSEMCFHTAWKRCYFGQFSG